MSYQSNYFDFDQDTLLDSRLLGHKTLSLAEEGEHIAEENYLSYEDQQNPQFNSSQNFNFDFSNETLQDFAFDNDSDNKESNIFFQKKGEKKKQNSKFGEISRQDPSTEDDKIESLLKFKEQDESKKRTLNNIVNERNRKFHGEPAFSKPDNLQELMTEKFLNFSKQEKEYYDRHYKSVCDPEETNEFYIVQQPLNYGLTTNSNKKQKMRLSFERLVMRKTEIRNRRLNHTIFNAPCKKYLRSCLEGDDLKVREYSNKEALTLHYTCGLSQKIFETQRRVLDMLTAQFVQLQSQVKDNLKSVSKDNPKGKAA